MPHLFADDRPPAVELAALGDLGGAIGASLLVSGARRARVNRRHLVAARRPVRPRAAGRRRRGAARPLGRGVDRGRGRHADRRRSRGRRALARGRARCSACARARAATRCSPPLARGRRSVRRRAGRSTAGRRSPASPRTCCATPATTRRRRRCCGRCGRRVRSAAPPWRAWPRSRRSARAAQPPRSRRLSALRCLRAWRRRHQLAGEQREPDRHDELDRAAAAERRLAVLALAHVDGHLDQPQLGVGDPHQRLDLGRLAHVRVAEQVERLVVDRVHAAGAVGDRLAQPQAHQQPQQRSAEHALGRRLVALAVPPDSGRKREPTATSHSSRAPSRASAELGRRVLAVGVEPAAERVAARGRLPVALGDAVPQPVVLGEADTSAPPARATAAVSSVDPSSITSRSASAGRAAPPRAAPGSEPPRSRPG